MKAETAKKKNGKGNGAIADKRGAILRAAISVFARNGFFNSKVADIASEAGIADGTVYLYFKSKDDILHSVFDRAMEEFISEGRRELEEIEKKLVQLNKDWEAVIDAAG